MIHVRKRIDRKHAVCHVFAETTHVVTAPRGYACVVKPTTYLVYVLSKSAQEFQNHKVENFH